MNFRVTCSDSGLVQRASGANTRTRSKNSVSRARISSGVSRAIKSRIGLHQFAAHHVQSLLACPMTDTLTISRELTFQNLGPLAVGEREEHEAHRLLLGSAARTRNTSNADAVSGLATLAN